MGRLRLAARANLALLAIAGCVSMAKLAAVGRFWSFGAPFAFDRTLVAGVLVLLPAIGVAVCSLPRLWRIARDEVEDPGETTSAGSRRLASAPGLVVPVQAAALGAAETFYVTVFRPIPRGARGRFSANDGDPCGGHLIASSRARGAGTIT